MHWTELFAVADTDEDANAEVAPRLGIDFVQASASKARVSLRYGGSSSNSDDEISASDALELVVHQDLGRYGIAGVVWNCARALISFVQREHPLLLASKRVLELGAGTGVVGLALAAAASAALDADGVNTSPTALLLTDLPDVLPLLLENVHSAAQCHVSLQHCSLDTQVYCWGDAVSDALSVDVVFASDCLYEPDQYTHLLASLVALTDRQRMEGSSSCHNDPVTVLLAYKQRFPARERTFFVAASKHFTIDVTVVDRATCATVGNDAIYICSLVRCDVETA